MTEKRLAAWAPDAGWVLTVIGLFAPILPLGAPLGMSPLGVIVGLGAILAHPDRRRIIELLRTPPFAMILALCAYGGVSALWAIDPPQTLLSTARLTALTLGGGVLVSYAQSLPPALRERALRVLPWMIALGGMIAAVELLTNSGVSRGLSALFKGGRAIPELKSPMSRGFTVISILIWPAAVLAWRRYGAKGAILTVIPALALLASDSLSSKMAITASILFFPVACKWPRLAFRLLAVLVVAFALAAPLAAYSIPSPQETFERWTKVPPSGHHRLTIWNFAAQRTAEKPILGWGLDSARAIPGGEDEIRVERYHRPDPRYTDGRVDPTYAAVLVEQYMPLHPHSFIIQWWLELGAAGTALAVLGMLTVLKRIEGLNAPAADRAAWGAAFLSGMTVSAVSYGFWQSWWLSSLWMAAGLCAALAAPPSKPSL